MVDPEVATVPSPEMLAEVALLVDQESVEVPPGSIELGFASNEEISGTVPVDTFTVTCDEADPWAFVAVKV